MARVARQARITTIRFFIAEELGGECLIYATEHTFQMVQNQSAFRGHFAPGVFERDRSIEHRFSMAVGFVQGKITQSFELVTKRGISLYIVGQQSHPFHRSKYMIIKMFTLQAK